MMRWDTTASSLVNCKRAPTRRSAGTVRLWRDIATHQSDAPQNPVGYRALRNAPSITIHVGLKCRGRQVVEMGASLSLGPDLCGLRVVPLHKRHFQLHLHTFRHVITALNLHVLLPVTVLSSRCVSSPRVLPAVVALIFAVCPNNGPICKHFQTLQIANSPCFCAADPFTGQ